MNTEEKNIRAQKRIDFSKTPGRNRPRATCDFSKPGNLQIPDTEPLLNNKLLGISCPNTFANPLPSLHNDLKKPNNIPDKVNHHQDAASVFSRERSQYSTDSSSGGYDGDSDGGTSTWSCDQEGGPVYLRITGLDSQQDFSQTRRTLTAALANYTEVLGLSIFTQRDSSVVASVMVPSLQDARIVISNLQRQRLGQQRIRISFHNTSPEQRNMLRSQVAALLSKLGGSKIPLFKFKEFFKNKYMTSVSVSELRRMRDICVILEEESGRMIAANPWAKPFFLQEQQESSFCEIHHPVQESYTSEPPALPCVVISLGVLTERCHAVLKSHDGRVPLASLEHCLSSLFGPITVSYEVGVSLEHLVSCVPGVEIIQMQGSIKFLSWAQRNNKPAERPASVVGLSSQLIELLRSSPKCVLSFPSFISAYHRHFGKQFRLSEFGHTKLLDLLESLPHVVQVIGFGTKKEVTLSHKAQMKRFKHDLTKLLNTQSNRYIDVDAFASLYFSHFQQLWEPYQYGLCSLEDLLNCVISAELQLKQTEEGKLRICTREQTAEEELLTNKFKCEVVKLLKHSPDCSMPFNKFIPTYHNSFGKQCRVLSYGFHKLIDLFSAISDTVTVEDSAGVDDKLLTLTLRERLKVAGERIHAALLTRGGSVSLLELEGCYHATQIGVIDPVLFGCHSLHQMLNLLPDYVKVVPSPFGYVVQVVPLVDTGTLSLRVRYLMLRSGNNPVSSNQFRIKYKAQYGATDINVTLALSRIPHIVRVKEQIINLTPSALFSNQVYTILYENGNRLALANFEATYAKRFGSSIKPTELGCRTSHALLYSFPEMFRVTTLGENQTRFLTLNPAIRDAGFPIFEESSFPEYSLWSAPRLISIEAPDPSTLPLPQKSWRKILSKPKTSANGCSAVNPTFLPGGSLQEHP